jgi:membrane protease YdiL (CAAX protease family)
VILSAIPWDFILILLVLGVFVPWRGAVRVKRLLAQPMPTSFQRFSLYASTITFQWLMVAIIAWRCYSRRLGPDELGLVISGVWRTLWIALIFTALLVINQRVGLRRMAQAPADRRGFVFQFTEKIMPRTSAETLAFAALACTAGISEEFIYRGFVLAAFSRAINDSTLATLISVLASSIWFAAAHSYQGKRGVFTTFVVGLLFSAVRLWSGNLAPAVAAHIAIDLVAGLYGPRLLRNVPGPPSPAAIGEPASKITKYILI